MSAPNYDVFICHASEDKKGIVAPLVRVLQSKQISVWYDDDVLKLGDSLRECIDEGLRDCRFGVVVLSPHFFKKHWTRRELDALVCREETDGKVVLPVWHNVTSSDVGKHSPILRGKLAAHTSDGLDIVAQRIVDVVKPDLARKKAGVLDDLADLCCLIGSYLRGEDEGDQGVVPRDVRAIGAVDGLSKAIHAVSSASDINEINEALACAYDAIEGIIQTTAYCGRCHTKVDKVTDGLEKITAKGTRLIRGRCPNCGTTLMRMGGLR